jgi:hypothetical protein
MGDRVHNGLVSFDQAEGWMLMPASVSNKRGARPGPHPNRVLRSPRSDGRFELGTIGMPEDMGPFDVERLKNLVAHGRLSPLVSVATFDEVAGIEQGIACVARTTVTEPNAKFLDEFTELFMKDVVPEERAELERTLSATTIRRDWYVARGTEMANVWYRGPNAESVAADLVDCEAMVRSIRFESVKSRME